MNVNLSGIHHVTMIAGEPQRNLDFYVGLLGMKFVKRTINYDDPGAYHFYFGDETGSPGSLLTFFPHPNGFAGRLGAGQATLVRLEVPPGAIDAWIDRFAEAAQPFEAPDVVFEERTLRFVDPDGLPLALVESSEASEGIGIRRVHSIVFSESDLAPTAALLADMGAEFVGTEGDLTRFRLGTGLVDLRLVGPDRGRVAVGSVHHVAFSLPDDEAQLSWLSKIQAKGLHSSPVMERNYFRSIYFREPGGALFEFATAGPGMLIDETIETMAVELKLPAWMEPQRSEIEKRLQPIHVPVRGVR